MLYHDDQKEEDTVQADASYQEEPPSSSGLSPLEISSLPEKDGIFRHSHNHGGGSEAQPQQHLQQQRRRLTLEQSQQVAHDDLVQTIAGVAGNVLEWYDFAIFGFLSDVIGQVFFPPNQSGNRATIESFAVFGGAFVMRPLGGLIMGYIGDVYGRKHALVLSIFLMAIPTFAMGCLPSYARVGYASTISLIVVRLLQGLSVGGQLMSSLVFTLENHPTSKWGLYGSFVMAAANCGTLLGSIAGFILRASLTQDQLVQWGWRVRFCTI